ncbi:MAG: replication-relaxation family protein [Labedaea sp.]
MNDFFCALAAHRNPARLGAEGRVGGVSGLRQWWSEKRCIGFFVRYDSGDTKQLRPDGYGCWEDNGRAVRFFLEHDTGTESLPTVVRKLDDYRDFPTDRFGILLFSVHSTRREIALRQALRRDLAGRDPGFVIATAVRAADGSFGHLDGPAGPVWGLWTPHGTERVTRRDRLAELPARGPHVEHAPNTDQPLNEAAFDPTDRDMLRLINTPLPQRLEPAGNPDDDLDDLTLYDDTVDDADDDIGDDDVYRLPVVPTPPDTRRPRRPRRSRWIA